MKHSIMQMTKRAKNPAVEWIKKKERKTAENLKNWAYYSVSIRKCKYNLCCWPLAHAWRLHVMLIPMS